MAITRGTTPTNTFKTSVSLVGARIYVTYTQAGETVFEKTNEDMQVTDDAVIVTLSQEDTLALDATKMVEIQIRYINSDGVADASNIITTSTKRILKDGEISYV